MKIFTVFLRDVIAQKSKLKTVSELNESREILKPINKNLSNSLVKYFKFFRNIGSHNDFELIFVDGTGKHVDREKLSKPFKTTGGIGRWKWTFTSYLQLWLRKINYGMA